MSIEKGVIGQTVVIIAQSFNPSVFNQYWLINEGLIEKERILEESVFAPGLTHVVTPDFRLLVVPEQLQFTLLRPANDVCELLAKTLIKIIEKLSDVPYKAVGINFNWKIKPEKTISQYSSELFFKNNIALFGHFDVENARFGCYMSRDFNNARLKLDIKPVIIEEEGISNEYILFAFNFHADVNNANSVLERLKSWNEYWQESIKVVNLL